MENDGPNITFDKASGPDETRGRRAAPTIFCPVLSFSNPIQKFISDNKVHSNC